MDLLLFLIIYVSDIEHDPEFDWEDMDDDEEEVPVEDDPMQNEGAMVEGSII